MRYDIAVKAIEAFFGHKREKKNTRLFHIISLIPTKEIYTTHLDCQIHSRGDIK